MRTLRAASLLLAGACALAGCDRREGAPAAAPAAPSAAASAGDVAPVGPRTLLEGSLVSGATLARVLERGSEPQWFGLYLGEKKIGTARVELRRAKVGEPGALVSSVEATLRLAGDGADGEVRFGEERFYAAEPPHALVALVGREETGAGPLERRYRRAGDEMIVTQTVAGTPGPERRVAASRETLITALTESPDPDDVAPGMRARVPSFDSERERDEMVEVEVTEVGTRRLSGVETRVAILRARKERETTATETAIAAGGVVLSASFGPDVVLRWEEREVAQSNVAGFHIVDDAVPVDRPLGDPARVRELDLVIRAPDALRLRDAPNQRVTRRPDGALAVALRSIPGPPVQAAERAGALEATAAIDARDPSIVRLARQIVGDEEDPRLQSERLVAWVFANLSKDLSTNLSTASQVLARRTGDCTEHALLFVALARAIGLPAREVSGLVYMGDDTRRFAWHAWAEVDLGGRWVQVDPSWGEPLANATHLTLGVDGDFEVVGVMASLSISAPERAR